MGRFLSLGLIVATLPVTVPVHAIHVAFRVVEKVEQIKDAHR